VKTSQERINLRFNLAMLDKTIIAILDNVNNKKFISNVLKLFSSFDQASYKIDWEKEFRVFLIINLASSILNKGFSTKEEVLSNIQIDGKYYDDCNNLLNTLYNAVLSIPEIQSVDEAITQQLKYACLEKQSDDIVEIINNIKAEAYDNLDKEMDKLYNIMNKTANDIRDAKESIEESKYDISMADSDALLKIQQELIDDERDPSTKIKTGIQMLNTMLDGGWEKGRCYLVLGVAKGFKSGLLLNAAIWAKKYNNLKPKDPTKQPVVLYLTMENSLKETFKRINAYTFGNNFKASNYTAKEITAMLSKNNIITPNDKSSVGLEIKFRPNKSISTRDLYNIFDELEKEGKEVVFFVFDYIKRIRPESPDKRGEQRIDLGEVVNELSMLAKIKDIPVLSAHQMNREAYKMIEAADSYEEKAAIAGRMGASQTGDSIDIIQNCDMAFIINRLINQSSREDGTIEYSDKYLMFNCIVSRGKMPEISQFQARFVNDNDLRLWEDIYDEKPATTIGVGSEFIVDRSKYNTNPKGQVRRLTKSGT